MKAGREEDNREEMVWWPHRLNGCESEPALGDSEGQKILSCYSPLGHKDSDMTVTEQQDTEYISLCFTVGPSFLSILYVVVMYQLIPSS